ncbi:MAG: hypothetical protein KGH87_06615 [Thaumarchaeota archaeon]|nr:hypothetical protein [Nitrososphaerota archaeon]
MKEYARKYAANRRKRSPEKVLETNRKCRRKKYGVPNPDGKDVKGVCPLCHKDVPELVPDHCHSTGKFRGWICRRCNWCLGVVADSVDTLGRMIGHLTK